MDLKAICGIFLLVSFVLISCKKSSNSDNKPITQTTDIYAAGSLNTSNGKDVATYWKNGVPIKLTDSIESSSASAIAINGNDIYVAGTINHPQFGSPIATYWKNGVEVMLTDHSINSWATAIAIEGNDVYVAGYTTVDANPPIATYWKNGIATQLTDGSFSSYANSIVINGSDVYVGGYTGNNKVAQIAIYWKNGTANYVTDDASFSQINGLALNGGNLYAAGEINLSGTYYWYNNATTSIPGGTFAYAIAIMGSDVYVAGNTYINASPQVAFWKNAVETKTIYPSGSSSGNAIAVSGKDVYVGGYTHDAKSFYQNAAYWKNGTLIKLSKLSSTIYGIAIVSH